MDFPCRPTKFVAFQGTSLDGLRAFPPEARREAGQQLDRVQRGLDPDDWKPMPNVGPSIREMCVRDEASTFRVIYTATRPEAVYVLHAFQEKTPQAAKRDLDLAKARSWELVRRGL